MSTSATIARHNADGSFDTIYLHSDGYTSHAFTTLRQYYDTQDKVDELIALGDLSFLAGYAEPTPDEAYHSFGNPAPGVCVAYTRDRGEPEAQNRAQRTPILVPAECQNYTYVWSNGEWYGFFKGMPIVDESAGVLPLAPKLAQIEHTNS